MTYSTFNKEALIKRLESKKVVVIGSGCWLFGEDTTGAKRIYISDRPYKIARVSAYIYLGLNLDDTTISICHECKTKDCWNPKHIYIGNQSTNALDRLRDGTQRNQNTEKTHCKYGHLLSGKNLFAREDKDGHIHRRCRICLRRNADSFYEKKRRKNSL